MRDGTWLVGYGMAGVTFTPGQARCQASVSIRRDGTAHVRSAATDLGTGTYTIATQVTAELLGLDTTPPAGASDRCRSTLSSCCEPG